MITGTLQEIAGILRGELSGEDHSFLGVSTDTRTLEAGQLFVALVGPNFDGHDFISAAADRGAAGALVSVTREGSLPSVRVPDTLGALDIDACKTAFHDNSIPLHSFILNQCHALLCFTLLYALGLRFGRHNGETDRVGL